MFISFSTKTFSPNLNPILKCSLNQSVLVLEFLVKTRPIPRQNIPFRIWSWLDTEKKVRTNSGLRKDIKTYGILTQNFHFRGSDICSYAFLEYNLVLGPSATETADFFLFRKRQLSDPYVPGFLHQALFVIRLSNHFKNVDLRPSNRGFMSAKFAISQDWEELHR